MRTPEPDLVAFRSHSLIRTLRVSTASPMPRISNHHGGSVTYKHIDNKGFDGRRNPYLQQAAMDECPRTAASTTSPTLSTLYYACRSNYQIDPHNVGRLNYSVSDYDIRNSFVLDFVYEMPFHFQNAIKNQVLGGWTLCR